MYESQHVALSSYPSCARRNVAYSSCDLKVMDRMDQWVLRTEDWCGQQVERHSWGWGPAVWLSGCQRRITGNEALPYEPGHVPLCSCSSSWSGYNLPEIWDNISTNSAPTLSMLSYLCQILNYYSLAVSFMYCPPCRTKFLMQTSGSWRALKRSIRKS